MYVEGVRSQGQEITREYGRHRALGVGIVPSNDLAIPCGEEVRGAGRAEGFEDDRFVKEGELSPGSGGVPKFDFEECDLAGPEIETKGVELNVADEVLSGETEGEPLLGNEGAREEGGEMAKGVALVAEAGGADTSWCDCARGV